MTLTGYPQPHADFLACSRHKVRDGDAVNGEA
jgi:hypothetical protein